MSRANAFEEALAKAAASGAWLDGREADGPAVLRASYLRCLMLRLAPDEHGRFRRRGAVEIAPPGIRVRHATISGDLDLDDATDVDGQALPSLVLEDCVVNGAILLAHARIDRLSLRGTAVVALRATQAAFGGTVDLAGVHPSGGANGECWLVLDGARIDGDLDLCGARARAPAKPEKREAGESPFYAVQAIGVEITGQILAFDVEAAGGIGLRDATVRGESWFRGARVVAGEGSAFGAQNATFTNGLMLDSFEGGRRFEATGEVWLLGMRTATLQMAGAIVRGAIVLSQSRIDGRLDCSGAEIGVKIIAGEGQSSLEASSARLGALTLSTADSPSTFTGTIGLFQSTIEGSLVCLNIDVTVGAGQEAIDATNAVIGAVLLSEAEAASRFGGGLMFDNAAVAGLWRLDGATVQSSEDAPWPRAIALNAARIGDLSITNCDVTGSIFGRVAQVERDLRLFGCSVKQKDARTRYPLVNFDLSRVGGYLQLHPEDTERHFAARPFLSQGPISFDGASIGGSLLVDKAKVWNGDDSARKFAFSAINASIGFDASFRGFAAQGMVDLSGIAIGRRLRVELVWPFDDEDDRLLPSRLIWNLRHASAQLLCDDAGRGWEMDWPAGPLLRPSIITSGFDYRSIENLASERLDERMEWLGKVAPNVIMGGRARGADGRDRQARSIVRDLTFASSGGRLGRARVAARRLWRGLFPDLLAYESSSYLQLSSVYRRSGRDTDADEILREKMRRDGRSSRQPKRALWVVFDWLFGFGFRPRNAFLTVMGFLVLGWLGTSWADGHGDLVIDAAPVATIAGGAMRAGALDGGLHPALQIAERDYETALPCGSAISPLLYAIDTFVPLIDLRQETKCEPANWRWVLMKALYAIIGWIVTSLGLLTISGILRREAERT